MGFWSKLTIGILVLLAGFYVKATFFDGQKYEKKLRIGHKGGLN